MRHKATYSLASFHGAGSGNTIQISFWLAGSGARMLAVVIAVAVVGSRVEMGPSQRGRFWQTCRRLPPLLAWLATLSISAPSMSLAGTFLAFGPQDYLRATSQPVAVTSNFTILNPRTDYTLRLDNGGRNAEFARVSSAVITLNGRVVVGERELNQTIAVIEKRVTLLTANTLAVQLQGQPGGGITLQVSGVDNDPPMITATIDPPANTAGWHNTNVRVRFTCVDATSGIATCSEPVTVEAEGASQVVAGTAVDQAGNRATASLTVNLDKTLPNLAVTSPADRDVVNAPEVTVTGTVDDLLSGVTSVIWNGRPASVANTSFIYFLSLSGGANLVVVQARDLAGNVRSASLTLTFAPGPEVIITAPANLSVVNTGIITVTGTVDDSATTVEVNAIGATVSGGTFTAAGVQLRERNNTITAVARNAAGHVGTASIRVTHDTTPPTVVIESPRDGLLTTEPVVTVVGAVNDMVGYNQKVWK